MNKKLVFSSLAIFLASAVAVSAVNGGVENIFDFILEIFGYVFIDFAEKVDINFFIWMKIMLFLFLFSLLYAVTYVSGLNKIFETRKNIRVVVALVISFISVAMMPNAIVESIAKTYGIISSFVFIALPVAGIIYLIHTVFPSSDKQGVNRVNHIIKAALYYLLATIINNFLAAVSQSGWTAIEGWHSWGGFAEGICSLMMLYHLFAAIFSFGGEKGVTPSKGWDWFKNVLKPGEKPPKPPEEPPQPPPPPPEEPPEEVKRIERAELDYLKKYKGILENPVSGIGLIDDYIKKNKIITNSINAYIRLIEGWKENVKVDWRLHAPKLVNLAESIDIHSKKLIVFCSNVLKISERLNVLSKKLLAQPIPAEQKTKIEAALGKVLNDAAQINDLVKVIQGIEPKIENADRAVKGDIIAVGYEGGSEEQSKNAAMKLKGDLAELTKLKFSEQKALTEFITIYKRMSPNLDVIIKLLEAFVRT